MSSSLPYVLDLFEAWLPQMLLDTIASLSFLTHFASISKGVIDLRDLVYFLLMIVFWLTANVVILESGRGE